MTLAAGRTV